MNRLKAFGAFWWDFVIGDDWRVAAGVVAALLGTWLLHRGSVPAWWLLPVVVFAMLTVSVRGATRKRE